MTSCRLWRKWCRARFHGLGIVVQVADQDDQAAPLEPVGQAVEGRSQVGRPAGLDGLEVAHHLVEVPRRAPRGHVEPDLGVEGRQPHGVLLAHHQVGQHRRQVRGVLQLGDPGGLAVGHRGAGVQEDLGAEVGLFFILLDVEPVGPAQNPPVEVARVVAGAVLAVLGELDAEPLVGAGVQPRDEPLDHAAGHQRKVLHPRQGRGVQVAVSSIAAHRS